MVRADGSKSAHAGRLRLLMGNSVANLIRGVSSSAVNVLLPLLLVIVLLPEHYAAWALVFSISAYLAYFDLGIPTTMQSVVARAHALDDVFRMRRATMAGTRIIGMVGAVFLVAAALIAASLGSLAPEMPPILRGVAATSLLVLALGQLANLLTNAVSAYFAAQQRSSIPALIVTPARLASMGAALAAAVLSGDIVVIAVGYATPLVVGLFVLFVLFLSDSRNGRLAGGSTDVREVGVKSLLKFSGPLMIWGVCALIITGGGTLLVARLDYGAIVPFSVAAIVVSGLAGLLSAATAPLLPEFTRLFEVHGIAALPGQVLRVSRMTSAMLFGCVALLLGGAPWYLPLLIPGEDALRTGWPTLVALLVGSAVHLSATPLTLAFIATQRHRRIILPPVLQAAVYLTFALLLGGVAGAPGVAAASLIAAVVGVLMTVVWSARTAGFRGLPVGRLLRYSLGYPLAAIATITALISALVYSPAPGSTVAVVAVTAAVGSLPLFLLLIPAADRARLGALARRRRGRAAA